MKRSVLKRIVLLLGLASLGVLPVRAQDDAPLPMIGNLPQNALPQNDLPPGALPLPGSTPGARGARALKILEIDDKDVSKLRGLATSGADAVSVGASLDELKADGAARASLAGWVRDGGVVFLHTDAAQLFGYQTVQARESTSQLAGQLYGRARNALPLFAHPLLWSGAPIVPVANTNFSPLAPSSRMLPDLGVQVVYYQLAPGDDLVVSHPNAVPILRVTDLVAPQQQPLYACAIAPFGSGWAIFSPRLIEANRADGATFVQNLLRLVRSKAPSPFDAPPLNVPAAAPAGMGVPSAGASTPATTAEPLIGIPAPSIEQLSEGADGGNWAALLSAWQKAQQQTPSAFTDASLLTQLDKTARLLIGRSEYDALASGLAAASAGGKTTSLRALVFVLRARLEWQRRAPDKAESWLAAAEKIAPDAAEILLWRGVLTADNALDITIAAQERGALFGEAAQDWNDALAATPLVRATKTNAQNTNAQNASLAGIPVTAIRTWIASAGRASQLMAVEPPLVSTVESELGGLVVRHFRDDPTLRFAIPAAAILTRSDQILGWNMDEEEILIFPSEQYYGTYSASAQTGGQEMEFNPLARRGNVVGNRILMVSQFTLPVLIDPGPPPRFAQAGAAVPAILGRMHAQVLINALAQDGTPPPAWMQLGLMSLSNIALVSEAANFNNGRNGGGNNRKVFSNQIISDELRRAALANALLTPDQFENVNIANDRAGVIEAQARRLMLFFYARFGPGAVVETLQRFGAGESPDTALEATTQMSQQEFFLAWSDADFGRTTR